MYSNPSSRASVVHVDLPESRENASVQLNGVRQALIDGAVSIPEARVAVALILHEGTKGIRAIERRSGLSRKALLGEPGRNLTGVIPVEGASSVLLQCDDRGHSGLDEDHARTMSVRVIGYRSSAHHDVFPLFSTSLVVVQEVLDNLGENDLDDEDVNGAQMSAIAQDHLAVLDPARGQWDNRKAMGDVGWALALVFGFEKATTTDLDTIARITRLSPAQLRKKLAMLEEQHWVTRTKQGRKTVVTVDFTLMLHEDLVDGYNRVSTREMTKALTHQCERRVALLRKTALGWQAHEMWRTRSSRLRLAQHIADTKGDRTLLDLLTFEGPHWQAVERIHDYLLAEAKQQKTQEAPQEALSASQRPWQPLEALESQPISERPGEPQEDVAAKEAKMLAFMRRWEVATA